MFAAVDLGSNSFRLHIGRHDGDTIRIVKSARDPVRLGAGFDNKGNLTPAAMQSAIASLTRFNSILSTYPLDAVRVVATNAMRMANNSAVFLPAAEAAIAYPIEIISGEEEGRLIYMGVASSLPSLTERRLVLDIGGGSTELILGRGHEIEQVESFSIGTVPQTLSFFREGKIDADTFDAAILSARSRFEDGAHAYRAERWSCAYGSSGTIRAIADAIGKNGLGDGTLSLKSLEALKRRLIQFGHAGKIDLIGMKADRTTSIPGGLAILIAVMQELGIKVMKPIEAGLRMGVLWDLQLRATKRDRREQSVRDFTQRFHADVKRADFAAHTASAMLSLLKPTDDKYVKLLNWAGLLHEIGLAVSHSGYHKHAAYMIEHADLSGFTTREQRLMSNLVLAQKGNLRKVGDSLADADFVKAILALRLAVMFMHAHIAVDIDEVRLKIKSKIELELPKAWVNDHPTVAYLLDKEKECWSEVGIDFSIKLNS